jgi:hypothetical protein
MIEKRRITDTGIALLCSLAIISCTTKTRESQIQTATLSRESQIQIAFSLTSDHFKNTARVKDDSLDTIATITTANGFQEIPEQLGTVTNRKLDQLAEIGVEGIGNIPENFPLTALQDRIRQCVTSNQEFISPDLRSELLNVEYPIHFLDFETISPAVPRYAGTRPYQTIPFQWSDHILYDDGSIEHLE